MLVIRKKDERFPAGSTKATKAMTAKLNDDLIDLFGSLFWKYSDNKAAAIVPALHKFNNILRYPWDLGHTQARNVYDFLKVRC